MADRTRGGVRSFLLLFAGSLLAGVVVGYIAGGGSRGRAPEAKTLLVESRNRDGLSVRRAGTLQFRSLTAVNRCESMKRARKK